MDVERNIKISLIEDPTADAPGHLTLDVENESLVNQSGTVGHGKENWTSNIHHLQFFFIYEMLRKWNTRFWLRAFEIKTFFRYFFELLFHGAEWMSGSCKLPFPIPLMVKAQGVFEWPPTDPLLHAIGHRQVMLGAHGAFGQQPRLGFKIKLFERLTKF